MTTRPKKRTLMDELKRLFLELSHEDALAFVPWAEDNLPLAEPVQLERREGNDRSDRPQLSEQLPDVSATIAHFRKAKPVDLDRQERNDRSNRAELSDKLPDHSATLNAFRKER